ncbi:MAG: hypothetical protein U9Q33_10415 [Campylobacterota bacterium]|nr:hypothetical protein [Campylobacterota bacterium]
MQIIRNDFYLSKLDEIIDYMAQSSVLSTIKFLDKLDTIPNLVDMEKEVIVILDIFKHSYRKVVK